MDLKQSRRDFLKRGLGLVGTLALSNCTPEGAEIDREEGLYLGGTVLDVRDVSVSLVEEGFGSKSYNTYTNYVKVKLDKDTIDRELLDFRSHGTPDSLSTEDHYFEDISIGLYTGEDLMEFKEGDVVYFNLTDGFYRDKDSDKYVINSNPSKADLVSFKRKENLL